LSVEYKTVSLENTIKISPVELAVTNLGEIGYSSGSLSEGAGFLYVHIKIVKIKRERKNGSRL